MFDTLGTWFYQHLGIQHGGGMFGPPGSRSELHFGRDHCNKQPTKIAATYSNDGFDVMLGYPDEWRYSLRAGEARRFAWWVLWDWWVVSTWCGIKRTLYYWGLDRHIQQSNRRLGFTPDRAAVLDAGKKRAVKD